MSTRRPADDAGATNGIVAEGRPGGGWQREVREPAIVAVLLGLAGRAVAGVRPGVGPAAEQLMVLQRLACARQWESPHVP